MCEYIFVETAYSQTVMAMQKLRDYISTHPYTLVVIRIKITEPCWSSPMPVSHVAKQHIGRAILRNEDWWLQQTETRTFTVVRDTFTWVNITNVQIDIWMHETEDPIDIDVNTAGHHRTAYATMVSSFYLVTVASYPSNKYIPTN